MFESAASILQFYSRILDEHISRNNVTEKDFCRSVRDMAQVYAPRSLYFLSNVSSRKPADYSIASNRCAYLHKFAPLHTYIVIVAMKDILEKQASLFKIMLNAKQFKLCSLGGGPGSDAVGVLAALYAEFRTFKSSVTIIDFFEEWEDTFNLVTDHLRSAVYGAQWKCLLDNGDFNYIGADLLRIKTETVNNAINSASLITMVKFISAAAGTGTELMVEVSKSVFYNL